jgi:hypothetical protein
VAHVGAKFHSSRKTASFLGNVAEKRRCGRGKYRTMWRVTLVAAALLGFAISSAEAAHPSRTTCADRDSMFCAPYRGNPGYSGHKLSRSPARRLGAKSRNGAESAANIGQAHALNPTGAKPFAGAAQAKLLTARTFDPLASGSDSGELAPQPPAGSGTEPWLTPILIALGGGGILSLFLAKAAEL